MRGGGKNSRLVLALDASVAAVDRIQTQSQMQDTMARAETFQKQSQTKSLPPKSEKQVIGQGGK